MDIRDMIKLLYENNKIMNIVEINPYTLECIGQGFEGNVYKLNDDTAVKLIKESYNMENKFKKIIELKKYNLKNCIKIKDFVFFFNKIIGYSIELPKQGKYKDVLDVADSSEKLSYKIDVLKQVEDAYIEAHKLGISFIDMKYDNFLINEKNEVKRIDLDNLNLNKYKIDSMPNMFHKYYTRKFGEDIKPDIDILSNLLYLLHYLTITGYDIKRANIYQKGDTIIEDYVKSLDIDKEVCEAFLCILSDSKDKPYLNPYLEKLKSDKIKIYHKTFDNTKRI